MTEAERKAAVAEIIFDLGGNLNLFAFAQLAWRKGQTITGPEGLGFDAIEAALTEAIANRRAAA